MTTNLEKVIGICRFLSNMGGTNVYPEFGKFVCAFDVRQNSKYYLYDVSSTTLTFAEMSEVLKDKPTPNYNTMITMPIDWFGEKFMVNLLATMLEDCKNQLNKDTFIKLVEYVNENF